ncbi:MAG: dimethylsulfoniopropionate demethylase [Pseudomonadota bacterium]
MTIQLSVGPRVRKSPFYDASVAAGLSHATIYNHMYMPVAYGDPEAEYWRLIQDVSIWDVAVERQVEVWGPDAETLVQYLVPRDLSKFFIGQGKYVPVCDHRGVLLNDPVLSKLDQGRYWFSIADNDLLMWVRAVAAERKFNVSVTEPDASPLAIQGPKAEALISGLLGDWVQGLKYFWFQEADLDGIPLLVARSGWSKQGGFELYLLDQSRGTDLWNRVFEAGKPYNVGPGAPNYIERVESALLSVGADTDDMTNPFEVDLGKYVHTEIAVDYIGRDALRRIQDEGPKRRRIGVIVEGTKLPPNQHRWPVTLHGEQVGEVTASAFSPRLDQNIGLANVHADIADGAGLLVETEQGHRAATVTALPFITPPDQRKLGAPRT